MPIDNNGKINLKNIVLLLLAVVAVLVIAKYLVFSPKEEFLKLNSIIEMRDIQAALEKFSEVCGRYPTNDEGLNVLVTGAAKCPNYKAGEGVGLKMQDRWGNPFIYRFEGGTYRLLSLGNDWIEGTHDHEANVVTRKK